MSGFADYCGVIVLAPNINGREACRLLNGDNSLTNSVRICVISHFALFREALAAVIRAEEGLEVVAECPTVEEAVETVEAAGVAVVLLDLSMWGRSGADLSNLRSNFPGNVVVMADQDCQVELAEAFSYGWTVLPWGSSCEQMIVALRVSGRQPV